MTGGVTLERVEGWGGDLRSFISMADELFARPEARDNFADLITGLLAAVPRKNGWQLAAHAGHPTPDRQQNLLMRGSWNADDLRDLVREQVVTHLGSDQASEDARLVVDETAALKAGRKSVGVAYQYAGITGQVENCQTMVMLTYATCHGHSYIDRSLYLPSSWTDDPERCREAGVPKDVEFATKPKLATAMIARALEAGVTGAVAADSVYGRDRDFRRFCRDNHLTFVLQVPSDLHVTLAGAKIRVDAVAGALSQPELLEWQRYSSGEGSKGLKYHDWAWIGGIGIDDGPADGFEYSLLIRRSVSDPTDITYLLAHAPVRTPLPKLIRIGGDRWAIEEDNRIGKNEIGLDHYEVRKWTPWHRHVTSCMFAAAFLAITRAAELGKGQAEPDLG
jgi:SRSO17 transposase